MRLELRSREYVHPGCDEDPSPLAVLHPVGIPDPRHAEDPHPEDALLSELRVFLRRGYRLRADELACVRELAREALDLVDGPEGDFARLPVRRWLAFGAVAGAREGIDRARVRAMALVFVTFLRCTGRLAPGAAHAVRNAIAAAPSRVAPLPRAA